MFRVSGQTSSTNTWRPCVPNFKLLEGPVFRVYRDTDRHTPFSRERTVGFRRESAEWSSASSRSTTPSGAENATVSLSRVCSCNSIPRFLAHSVNPPPLGSYSTTQNSNSQALPPPLLRSPDPKAPSQASYLGSSVRGEKLDYVPTAAGAP